MLGHIKYQPVPVVVTFGNEKVDVEAELDKLYQICTGIFVSVPMKEIITSTFSRIELGGKEIFPEGYEVRMLTADWSVPVDSLYYELEEKSAGLKLKTTFRDSGLSPSYPYTAIIYLRLENQ